MEKKKQQQQRVGRGGGMAQRNLMLEKSVIRRDCFGGMLYFASFNAICLTTSLAGYERGQIFPNRLPTEHSLPLLFSSI